MIRSKKHLLSAICGVSLAAMLSVCCCATTVFAESEDNDNITVEEPEDNDNILDNIDLGNTDNVSDTGNTPVDTTPSTVTPVDVTPSTPTTVTPTNTTPKTGVDVVPTAVTATGSALACLGAAALLAKRKTK